jgi:ligand-binding sensor domain-containing protein
MNSFKRLTIWVLSVGFWLSVTTPVRADIRFYGMEQMSSNLIYDICQEGNGYLWVSTEYGLNRFDGISFSLYYQDMTIRRSIASNSVLRLLTDSDGRLWALSFGAVQRYVAATNDFERVTFPEGAMNFRTMVQTRDGHLLVISRSGLYQIDRQTLEATLMTDITKYLPDDGADIIFEAHDGTLWMCGKHQVVRYDKKRNKGFFYDEATSPYRRRRSQCTDL